MCDDNDIDLCGPACVYIFLIKIYNPHHLFYLIPEPSIPLLHGQHIVAAGPPSPSALPLPLLHDQHQFNAFAAPSMADWPLLSPFSLLAPTPSSPISRRQPPSNCYIVYISEQVALSAPLRCAPSLINT